MNSEYEGEPYSTETNLFRLLERASAQNHAVRVCYENREGETSQRSIEPLHLYRYGSRWYVRAFCHLRGEERTFALRRMSISHEEPARTTTPYAFPTTGDDSGSSPSLFTAVLFSIAAVLVFSLVITTMQSGSSDTESMSDSKESRSSAASSAADTGDEERHDSNRGEVKRWSYRGYTLVRSKSGVAMAPELNIEARSGRILHYIINASLFVEETGIQHEELILRYIGADSDANGHLSWEEVSAFQRRTSRDFLYRHNGIALPPDEFLERGGGDCEDFALYTCGMLRFWGWNSKVASYYPPGGGEGHAIAFVWSKRPIEGYGYFEIGEGTYAGGTKVRPGYWIPIDYEAVGGVTNAMDTDWELLDLAEPESLYRQEM